jgi:L-aminopeptidase/D-esterase-like protein
VKSICDIPGFSVGCAEDSEGLTGVTVLMCPPGTVGGMDMRGSATSTRQCDSLRPDHLVGEVHAICFAGGSAFGLDSAAGVMSYLAEKNIGLFVGYRTIPAVPTAVIFDCALGDHQAYPSPELARQACVNATSDDPPRGSHGAGCGATVGKVLGIGQAMKGGQGSHLVQGADGLLVGALAVVNAYGDVIDPAVNQIIAGSRHPEKENEFTDAISALAGGMRPVSSFENTVLIAVATNARLDKAGCTRVAKMAQTGLARTVKPCHGLFDGDFAVALSAGKVAADENAIGALAAEAVQGAVLDAVRSADGFGIIPDYKSFLSGRRPD